MSSRKKQDSINQRTVTTVENVPSEKPVEKTEAWRYLVRAGALLTFIISVLWLNFDLAYEPLVGFVAAFVAFFTTFFKSSQTYIGGWGWRLSNRRKDSRNEMLNRLQGSWIEGVLYTALRDVQEFNIGTSLTPDMVVKARNAGEDYRLRDTSKIEAIYKDFGRLLILGEPGSGKTILLLQLAETLLQKAHKNEKARIPVVFNLASWSWSQKSLREWLLDEFKTFYRVRRSVASKWLDESTSIRLIVMLDGLDEVREEVRDKCIEAINAFEHQYLIVCSRTQDYQRLTEKLNVDNAIMLQPLKEEAVNRYFSKQSGLTGLISAIEQDKTLREMTTIPFLLNTMIYTYGGRTAAQIGIYKDVIERRQKLFEEYIKRRLEDNPSPYGYERTISYLKWLATKMHAYTQTVFRPKDINWYWLDENSKTLYQRVIRIFIYALDVFTLSFYVILILYKPNFLLPSILIMLSIYSIDKLFDRYIIPRIRSLSGKFKILIVSVHSLSFVIMSVVVMVLLFRNDYTSVIGGLLSFGLISALSTHSFSKKYYFAGFRPFAVLFYRFTTIFSYKFPKNVNLFLQEMSQRHILRPLSGGYVFLHRSLLESLSKQEEIEVLLRLFTDYQTAHVAQAALVRFGERAVAPLVSTIHSGDEAAKVGATLTLIKIGSSSVEALIQALYKSIEAKDAQALRFIMISIIQIGYPAIDDLLNELNKKDLNYTYLISVTLGLIDDRRGVECLIRFFQEQISLFTNETAIIFNELSSNKTESFTLDDFKSSGSAAGLSNLYTTCDIMASALKQIGTEETLEAAKDWDRWKTN